MIRTTGVGKRYGRVTALRDVDLDVAAGSVVGVLGPNGSGKSTLFRVVLGLTAPDDGTVELLGEAQRPGVLTPERRAVVHVPDADDLYEDLTPRELAELSWRTHRRLVGGPTAFPRRRFDDLVSLFGLSEHVARRTRHLSHGTRRKSQVVAAVVCRPEVLVVDEPTNGLDPDQHVVLRICLRVLADAGCTVLLSTHNLGFAELVCDRVALLRTHVAVAGTPEEVRRRTGQPSLTLAYESLTDLDVEAVARRAEAALG